MSTEWEPKITPIRVKASVKKKYSVTVGKNPSTGNTSTTSTNGIHVKS